MHRTDAHPHTPSHVHNHPQKRTQTFTASSLISVLEPVSCRSRQLSNETRAGVKRSFAETKASAHLVFCTSSSFCYTWHEHSNPRSLVKERGQLSRTRYRLAGAEHCTTGLLLFHGFVAPIREHSIFQWTVQKLGIVQYSIYNKKYYTLIYRCHDMTSLHNVCSHICILLCMKCALLKRQN